MRKQLVVCGDSFSVGIGCHDLSAEPYGALLSRKLDKPIVNLAKGSSTNFSIFLQAKHVVDNLKHNTDLVLVSNTSYDRVDWFPIDYESKRHNIDNTEVNYHQYPPYGQATYHVVIDHPLKDDPKYVGKMYTENFRGVIDYWETFGSKSKHSDYYARFSNEPPARMKLLYDYALSIHDTRINRLQSIGALTMAHQLLTKAGINHLILTHEVDEYAKYMDVRNLVHVSWGELSMQYPDEIRSLHTSSQGHIVAYQSVLDKLIENGWA